MWSWESGMQMEYLRFQQYLPGYMLIFQAADKEVSQADLNRCKFSIRDTRPSWIHVLIGTLD